MDLEQLPWRICFADLRARGQGRESGRVWREDASRPGRSRTARRAITFAVREEQQKQLFAAVAHYGLGLGCSKVQNWCLRDGAGVGVSLGHLLPAPVRGQGRGLRAPQPVAGVALPEAAVQSPGRARPVWPTSCDWVTMARVGEDVAYRVSADLLALHVPFGCLDDDHLSAIPPATRLLIYPCPFAVSDGHVGAAAGLGRPGGTLLVTGDLSYDDESPVDARLIGCWHWPASALWRRNYDNIRRDAGRTAMPGSNLAMRLRAWCGLVCRSRPGRRKYWDATTRAGPVLVRNRVGQGRVYFCSDPLELASDDPATVALRRNLYRGGRPGLRAVGVGVEPDVPWLHVMRSRPRAAWRRLFSTPADGTPLQIGIPTSAGQLRLGTRPGWPALAVTTTRRTHRDHPYVVAQRPPRASDLCGGPGQKLAAVARR